MTASALTAHGDAWQVQGRVRARAGGGALEARGIRLMASGLPHPQYNGGDVTASDADLEAARAFYAALGVPWDVRVPSGMPWPHGRRLLTKRLMAVAPAARRAAPPVRGLVVREAAAADLTLVAAIDAAAFGEDATAWLAQQLGADGVDTALAELGGVPVATAHAVRSDGRAGPAVLLAGVGVLAAARRRGIAAAVSAWLLERAPGRVAHLHAATPDAARVYARLGFADAGALDVFTEV